MMAPDSDHPALVRLRAWCAARGIAYRGSLVKDGKFWRAGLRFSDSNIRFNAPAETADDAIARVVETAISWRDKDEQRDAGGPVNGMGTLSGRERPAYDTLEVPRMTLGWQAPARG